MLRVIILLRKNFDATPVIRGIRHTYPQVETVCVPYNSTCQDIKSDLKGDILITHHSCSSPALGPLLQEKRGIRWVHLFGTSISSFPTSLLNNQILTNSHAVSIPIAEWVMATILTFDKAILENWEAVKKSHFKIPFSLNNRNLAIFGFGHIGKEIAKRALAFNINIKTMKNNITSKDFDEIQIVRDMKELLNQADHLVLAAPLTKYTHQIINSKTLSLAKPGLHLVNVAQGKLIDHNALKTALDEKIVARASLDVSHPDPLPPDHWIHRYKNVKITPHISGATKNILTVIINDFLCNLSKYINGEQLQNIVDIERGY